ncbi:MAG: beta-ketoacyl-ACP synthase III [Planctomycetia bacterium]|nr:beta-ketoacyl-ACP synthase III [Planctomycetia bacterium]
MSLSIIGTGSALPARIFTNEDLSEFVEIDDEWIRTRTGIHQRHILTGDETLMQLATQAALLALENANISAEDLDYIIVSTVGGDFLTPSLACVVQKNIHATCPAFDLNAACSGFIFGLDTAAALLQCGKAKRILLISADGLSRSINWEDRKTCVLFGDGAAAVVLAPGDNLLAIHLHSQGNSDILSIPFPSGNFPFRSPSSPSYLRMDGQSVFKFAVKEIDTGISAVLDKTKIPVEKVDYILLHQANIRILEYAQRKLKIPLEKFLTNIANYGNTSSVSIPLMLDLANRKKHFSPGNLLILCAFGGGLTSGTAILRW